MKPLWLTKPGWFLGAFAVASLAVALVNPSLTSNIFSSCLWASLVASFLMALGTLHRISLSTSSREQGMVGRAIELPVVVENRTRWRRQATVVRESCPFAPVPLLQTLVEPLGPREKRRIERRVHVVRRGLHRLDRIAIRSSDPAGLFQREKRFSYPREILIFPETQTIREIVLSKRHRHAAEVGRPSGVAGAGQEFFGVREYRPTDGIRFIHWKASARHNRLMVRQFEENSIVQVNVLLDIDRRDISDDSPNSNHEHLIKHAASLVRHLAGVYCRLLFIAGSDRRQKHRKFGAAQGVTEAVMYTLATLKPARDRVTNALGLNLDRIPMNSTLFCFTMSHSDELMELFELLMRKGVDVRWIYAPSELFDMQTPLEQRMSRLEALDTELKRLVPRPVIVHPDTDIAKALEDA